MQPDYPYFSKTSNNDSLNSNVIPTGVTIHVTASYFLLSTVMIIPMCNRHFLHVLNASVKWTIDHQQGLPSDSTNYTGLCIANPELAATIAVVNLKIINSQTQIVPLALTYLSHTTVVVHLHLIPDDRRSPITRKLE